ncbi:MAG: twin-arginine translocase subunit TatC [Lentisphaeria bacterium]|nr:twin-arginine translocase subunit TatC [Lentisphaeria bacterium]
MSLAGWPEQWKEGTLMLPDTPTLTLWEHLDVLRRVLFKSIAALAVCSVLGLFVTPCVFRLLLFPVRDYLDPALRDHYFASSSAEPADGSPGGSEDGRVSLLLDRLADPELCLAEKVEIQSQCLAVLLAERGMTGANGAPADRIRVVYSSPVEPFMIRMTVAFLGGAVAAVPFIVHFFWAFASPGIRRDERRLVLKSTAAATLLFSIGIAFGYGFLPFGIPALLTFNAPGVEHIWPLRGYISFCARLIIAFGLVFEMPLVFGVLARFGLVTADRLAKGRVYAVILAFIAAAWLTPPDVFSQIALAIPMLGLYELSVFIVKKTVPTRVSR